MVAGSIPKRTGTAVDDSMVGAKDELKELGDGPCDECLVEWINFLANCGRDEI
jgi:hypothetical protein